MSDEISLKIVVVDGGSQTSPLDSPYPQGPRPQSPVSERQSDKYDQKSLSSTSAIDSITDIVYKMRGVTSALMLAFQSLSVELISIRNNVSREPLASTAPLAITHVPSSSPLAITHVPSPSLQRDELVGRRGAELVGRGGAELVGRGGAELVHPSRSELVANTGAESVRQRPHRSAGVGARAAGAMARGIDPLIGWKPVGVEEQAAYDELVAWRQKGRSKTVVPEAEVEYDTGAAAEKLLKELEAPEKTRLMTRPAAKVAVKTAKMGAITDAARDKIRDRIGRGFDIDKTSYAELYAVLQGTGMSPKGATKLLGSAGIPHLAEGGIAEEDIPTMLDPQKILSAPHAPRHPNALPGENRHFSEYVRHWPTSTGIFEEGGEMWPKYAAGGHFAEGGPFAAVVGSVFPGTKVSNGYATAMFANREVQLQHHADTNAIGVTFGYPTDAEDIVDLDVVTQGETLQPGTIAFKDKLIELALAARANKLGIEACGSDEQRDRIYAKTLTRLGFELERFKLGENGSVPVYYPKYAAGGRVDMSRGGVMPATSMADSGQDWHPAWLTDKEYVINAQSSMKNRSLLDKINANPDQHFAAGGIPAAARVASAALKSAGTIPAAATAAIGPAATAALGVVGGPIGIAVSMVADKGIELIVNAVNMVTGAINSSAERYGQYSPAIAVAQAQVEVQQIQGDIRRSRETGPELARYVRAQGDLQQRVEDVKMKMLMALMPIATTIVKILESIMPIGEGVVTVIGALLPPANAMVGNMGRIADAQELANKPRILDPTEMIFVPGSIGRPPDVNITPDI